MSDRIKVLNCTSSIIVISTNQDVIFSYDVKAVLDTLPEKQIFDLMVTSPPYEIGEEYEKKIPLDKYL